nr:MAG TPA: hypothetical protein [Caudoviricetes sp.]
MSFPYSSLPPFLFDFDVCIRPLRFLRQPLV